MSLDRSEIKGLEDILHEFDGYYKDYIDREETGNSEGKNKELYRGKKEAYGFAAMRIRNYMKWNGIFKD